MGSLARSLQSEIEAHPEMPGPSELLLLLPWRSAGRSLQIEVDHGPPRRPENCRRTRAHRLALETLKRRAAKSHSLELKPERLHLRDLQRTHYRHVGRRTRSPGAERHGRRQGGRRRKRMQPAARPLALQFTQRLQTNSKIRTHPRREPWQTQQLKCRRNSR
jgi:hypothetical protein